MRIRVLGQSVPATIAVLAAVEVVIFYLTLVAAAWTRFGADLPVLAHGPLWPRAVIFSLATAGSFLAFGLYSARQRARAVGIFVRVLAAVVTGVALTTVGFYLIPELKIGRGVLSLAAIYAAAAVVALRLGFSRFVDETPFKRRVLVYGTGRSAASIARLRRRSDQRGFVIVGFVQPMGEDIIVPRERVLESGVDLYSLCFLHSVDEIVVAMDDRRRAFPIRELLDCRLAGIDVTELLTFLERETGRVRIDILNPTWMIFGEGFRRDPLRLLTARALDLVASIGVLTVALPAMLVTALAIKLEDGWKAPVFYRQSRVGLLGRPFDLLKFRSMR